MGALTFVAPHGVDADLLAASIVVRTLVHICQDVETEATVARREEKKTSRSCFGFPETLQT